jgi:A/G-specific adenine glycosylase
MQKSADDIARPILAWYRAHRRHLPWRAPKGNFPDPYHVLVSEAMLQQTQVATVIPYFHRFIAQFPTLQSLAAADEQQVLRLWQGLGYYSRARNLRKTAQSILTNFGGVIPARVQDLLQLPGVGRYTAGAIASLAHGTRAPILDGNVTRVLCRLDAVKADPHKPAIRYRLWRRAEQILPPAQTPHDIADFNSALMELGATLCTPKSPNCPACPIRKLCQAHASNLQDQIPPARKPKPRPIERRLTLCIEANGKYLIEQRPPKGRWAGMWQFITLARNGAKPDWKSLGRSLSLRLSRPRHLGEIRHDLTHRRYEFEIWRCHESKDTKTLSRYAGRGQGEGLNHAGATTKPPRRWLTLAQLQDYPLPRPHLLIVELLSAAKPAQ